MSDQKKWGTVALIALIFGLIGLILSGPFEMSNTKISLDTVKSKPTKVEDALYGFSDFSRSLLAYIINGIFIILWGLLLIVPGIIKSLSYSMTFFIMEEDKTIDANSARKKSMEMMDGHKWSLFCLLISFIGWYILCILTLGILTFWVTPYVNTAVAEFYDSIREKNHESLINADELYNTK